MFERIRDVLRMKQTKRLTCEIDVGQIHDSDGIPGARRRHLGRPDGII